MQVSEAITIISTISEGIKVAKEACNEIPIGLFKPTKEKVIELQKQIEFLENHIRIGFPKLKDIIILYSDIKTDVSIARALSDKVSEIITLSEDISRVTAYSTLFLAPTRTEYTRIKSKVQKLPALDTSQGGRFEEKIDRIGTLIRELQIVSNNDTVADMEKNRARIAKLFQDISGEYSEIESTLAELLNKRVLEGFDNVMS